MFLITFMALAFVARIISYFVYGTERPNREIVARLRDLYGQDAFIVWILVVAILLIIVNVINNIYTQRMTKYIVKPLEPLNEGVRQIQNNNFTFRIDYHTNDEYRPVCEAFNEMAEKLGTSAAQHKKDEANRRELIAGISHDLRTPLTSIKGYLEGIEKGVASTPEMREKYLAIIKDKAAVMEHIIEQLFLFSKLDMDEFPLTMRYVDITPAITDMIEDSLSEYFSRGLEIKFVEMPKNVLVFADVLMLRNVVINLLENSVKYKTKEQGQMKISATVVNDSVLLRLADDGPGVHEDMLAKLFDVFYRTDPSRNKMGSGLGLAISAKIIERMGGNIHGELPDSGGLAIVIELPLVKGEVV